MGWHDEIESTLATFSQNDLAVDGLSLPASFMDSLQKVEVRSTTNPQTLLVVRAIAECAVDPMVTGIASAINDGLVNPLKSTHHTWIDRTASSNTALHRELRRVALYYDPTRLLFRGVEQRSALYPVLRSAAELVKHAYPVDHGERADLNKQPQESDIVPMIGHFAVVSHIHRALCGEFLNNVATMQLTDTVNVIFKKPTHFLYLRRLFGRTSDF